MIKVGLIGCGFMGSTHAACYKALESYGAQLIAIADTRPEYAQKAAQEYGVTAYETGMDLIEKADVDVVDICLPTQLHITHAVAAMRNGKNVFIEKPICLQEDEMELVQKVKDETGAKVQVGQVLRVWPEYVWLKKTKEEGTYGRLMAGTFKRLSARPTWASDNWLSNVVYSGGVAVDMHVHDVDFVRYLLGEPDRVQAQAYRDAEGAIQQIFSLYGYGDDVGISLEASWDYPQSFPFQAGYRVKFEKATAIYEDNMLTVYPEEGEPFHPEMVEEFSGENDAGGNLSSLGAYYDELKYFIEGLQGKNDLSLATVEEGIRSVRLVLKEIDVAGGLILKK